MALFDSEMRYLAYSSRWVRDYSLEVKGDLLGRSHYDVLPEIPEVWRELHQKALAGEIVQADLDTFAREDGTTQYLRYEVRPWYSGEDIGGVVMLTEDLTAQMNAIEGEKDARRAAERAQERLEKTIQALAEARDEAEAANRAKSNFLATMSHEIRTPMNAVVGYSDLLKTTSLDATQQEYVAMIQRASDRLLRLIDDVLDFSKVEADRLELQIVPFEVEPLVVRVLEQFAPAATEKGIELAYVPPASASLPVLQGDEKRIHQVLSNLVSNAVKFTSTGTIELAARTWPGEAERTVVLEVEVRDTGIGIEPDRLDEVFQPFVQIDSSMTRQYGGAGLGLAIARQFVGRMGGTLSAENRDGGGSAFRVRLPLALADAPVRRVVSTTPESLSGKRALVVDGQPESLAVTVAHVGRCGLEVESTTDPDEALAWIDEGRAYDIAVLDMEMPGTDGGLLAASIRERDAALPLAGLSSRMELGEAEASVDAVAVKPVTPDVLSALIHRAIRWATDTKPLTPIIRFHEAPPRPPAVDEMQEPARLRILVAEDEPDNQKLTLQMLRLLGYEAHLVASGAEALEQLHATPYDVVLMDVMMPGMDGLEATRRLRSELPPARQPRVVALTARALRSDREACLAAGMDDYLSKPVRIGDLARALSAVGV